MKISHLVFIFFLGIATFFSGVFFWFMHHQHVDFSILENYTSAQPSLLLDSDGVEWARFELDKRDPIALHQVPQHVIYAFLAAEDRYFFHHHGLSVRGIVRSIVVNVRHGKIVQGASTITQQLVKLLFFDAQKTFTRKFKEQFLALVVERQFTKEQILETYLNHIYFGCGIYGISAASQRFFGKSVAELDYAEAALLAGIQRCPAVYCPLLNPTASCKRRNLVLRLMHEQQYMDEAMMRLEQQKPLRLAQQHRHCIAPYFKEYLRVQLEEMFGKQALYSAGFKIKTTLDRVVQQRAEKEFMQQFNNLKNSLSAEVNGGLVSLDVKTGHIKALIGGVDFARSQFNRAIQAKRQLGSVIKPFVYAAALEQGYSFADTEIDEPIELNVGSTVWAPNNYNNKFEGEMTLANALSRSNNIVTIKMLLRVGMQRTIDMLHAAGFQEHMQAYPSLALGCVDVTLLEAAGAFNIFANNGVYVKPYAIAWIKDGLGTKIWSHESFEKTVISSRVAGQVTKVLNIGINRYLTRNNAVLPMDVMGKTGTTNDSRTCWFAGSSPSLTTVLYIGKDDNTPLGKNIFPVWTVFPIWLGMYKTVPHAQVAFAYDPMLRSTVIDRFTGLPCSSKHNDAIDIFH